MTAFLRRYFSLSAWAPTADFDVIALNVDSLRDPDFGYIAITVCLLGFGACIAFHPHGRNTGKDWGGVIGEAIKGYDDRPDYLHDFGPNVPVEDLGGKPVFYENGQPVYPGREHG